MPTKWTAADIPDQTGRIAVVTGATSGLGQLADPSRFYERSIEVAWGRLGEASEELTGVRYALLAAAAA